MAHPHGNTGSTGNIGAVGVQGGTSIQGNNTLNEIMNLLSGFRAPEAPEQTGGGGATGSQFGTSFFPGSFIGTTNIGPGSFRAGRNASMLENARQFGNRQAATLDPILRTLMQALGFGGGSGGLFGGGPSRADLLDPRLADIEAQRKAGSQRVSQAATSSGRDVTGSVFQDALQQLTTGATREGQRATGDVDTLLAQLGLGQQGIFAQLIQSLLGSLGGFQLA